MELFIGRLRKSETSFRLTHWVLPGVTGTASLIDIGPDQEEEREKGERSKAIIIVIIIPTPDEATLEGLHQMETNGQIHLEELLLNGFPRLTTRSPEYLQDAQSGWVSD